MIEKVFNLSTYETKENSKIKYQKPKVYNGLHMSKTYYSEDDEKAKICFETGKFLLENGIGKTKSGNFFIDVWMNEENVPLSEFISELDELNITQVWQNSKPWFGQQLDIDVVDNYYKYPLRSNSKTSKAYYRLKISPEVKVNNQFGKTLDLSDIHNNSFIKIKMNFEGIYFEKKIFSPMFDIIEIVYYKQRKKENIDFQFCESTDTFPENENYLDENEEVDNEDYLLYEKNNEEIIDREINNQNSNNEEERFDSLEQCNITNENNESEKEEYEESEKNHENNESEKEEYEESEKNHENEEYEEKEESNEKEEYEESDSINLDNNNLEKIKSFDLSNVLTKNLQDVIYASEDSENSYKKLRKEKKTKKEKKIILKGFRRSRMVSQASSYL